MSEADEAIIMKKMRVADFFCGAGGFSEGFRQKGFDVVFALDNWKPAVATHELNHPKCETVLMDILELDTPQKIDAVVPDVDVIVGSPPCIAFSGSNKAGKADKTFGIKLIEAYLRIVAWKKSKGALKYWVLENVPNSSKYIKERYTWKELGLPGKGPDLTMPQRAIVNSADYGAPQTRKRFLCGDFPLPQKICETQKEWIAVSNVLSALSNPLISEKPRKVTDPNYSFEINADDLTDHYYDARVATFEWRRAKRLKDDHGFMGRMSFPEDINRPSRTVMATRSASTRESMILHATNGEGKHIGYRLPTIREIACFMSFPITYQFEASNESSKYRLVGNAVCPKMSGALAESLLRAEGRRPPRDFISLPDSRPSFNLNGMKRISKMPSPRRPDAKFADHILYLKIRSFRVELNNKESDFKRGNIIWSCVLHHGAGDNARRCDVRKAQAEKSILRLNEFQGFYRDLKRTLSSLDLTTVKLQEAYCSNGRSKNISPDAVLETMKELVDKHFPESAYAHEVLDIGNAFDIGKKEIPLRIAAGLAACGFFVGTLKAPKKHMSPISVSHL